MKLQSIASCISQIWKQSGSALCKKKVVQQTEDETLHQAAGPYVVITDEGKTIEKQVAVCLRYVL